MAQGLSRPRIDYEETYSPVMYIITFCYLISLIVPKNWICYLWIWLHRMSMGSWY